MGQLRTGRGSSEHDDAVTAGDEAARAALDALGDTEPALVFVYSSVRYDLGAVLGAVRARTGDTPLLGGSTSGHFHDGVLTAPGRGVAVMVLGAGPYRFGVGSATGLRVAPNDVGASIVRRARAALTEPLLDHAALVVISCGLTGDQQQLISGVYRVAGAAVPVVGGAASDDRHMRETFVFHDGRVLRDAAVAVWVDSGHPLAVVRGHGWRPLGFPLPVTGVEGMVVRTIDGRPASEVFLETVASGDRASLGSGRTAPGAGDEPLLLGEAGRCFGLIEPDGSRRIRGAFLGPDGEMNTWVPLPPYSAVQVMSCTQDDLLDGCDDVPLRAFAGRTSSVLLAFSCVARLRILGDRAAEEAERLQSAAGRVPTFGFYTYGEFARTTSVDGVHNATVTALAL
ncbi:MAG: hypothetical protein QG622_3698 [Actinomycetota bacterium]|nr:hypothetical protein [Actinomycetota bacterium]